MNIQELKNEIRGKTLKGENTSLLKYIVAECERYNKEPTSVIEKLIEDNKTTYNICVGMGIPGEKYVEENKVLYKYLPEYISQKEISSHLSDLPLDGSGKSMGIAIKHLKSLGVVFKNEDLKEVLNSLAQVREQTV